LRSFSISSALGPFRGEARDLFVDGAANLFGRAAGLRDGEQVERRGAATFADAALHGDDRLVALDEFLIEPGAFAFEQQFAGERQGVSVRGAARGVLSSRASNAGNCANGSG
jgi:hypothetical protein